jgi:hypothetical protein
MIDARIPFVVTLILGMLMVSWVPSALFAVFLLTPRLPDMSKCRPAWCIQVALAVLILSPYALLFIPAGGPAEQEWLDKVIVQLEVARDTCDDPELRKVIDYTICRYDYIGPFGVKVVQLPEHVLGLNSPFCRGITIDESVVEQPPRYGAWILTHEAMHDWFPNFGHSHIDDDKILAAMFNTGA